MYDALLFLHVLAAFTFSVTIVMFSAYVLGARATPAGFSLSGWLWDIGGVATLIFGVWLALYVDGYSILDGWIIAAVVLWLAAAGTGARARELFRPVVEAGGFAAGASAELTAAAHRAAAWNWARTALAIALLAVMVWKPGA